MPYANSGDRIPIQEAFQIVKKCEAIGHRNRECSKVDRNKKELSATLGELNGVLDRVDESSWYNDSAIDNLQRYINEIRRLLYAQLNR